jgi:nucleoside-diphosphate-sugar epimerase
MQIAVTGATGFLGRRAVATLTGAGHQVRALILPEVDTPPELRPIVERLDGSLADPARVARLVEGAEVLLHLAAMGVQGRDRDWRRMTAVNVVEPLGLIEAASRAGVRQVVAAGTCLEYSGHGRLPDAPVAEAARCREDDPSEPTDPYGATKGAGGLLLRARCRTLGLPHWYLRLAGLYGPGDDPEKLLPAAIRCARASMQFEMTGGEQVRELLHADDAVEAFVNAVTRAAPADGLVVNVGTGEGISIAELVRQVFRVAGADPALVQAGARPYRQGEVHRIVMDVTRAAERLGWRARTELGAGLAAVVAAGA